MVLADGFIYKCTYDMGFVPLIESFNIVAPVISYSIFVLFACMLHVFKAGENNDDSYESNDPKLFWRLTSLYMSKFSVLILLFFLFQFTKYLM